GGSAPEWSARNDVESWAEAGRRPARHGPAHPPGTGALIVALPPREPDRPDQRRDDLHEAERGRDGRDRGTMSVGSAAFVVFVCAMCGALVIGWLNASAAKASATNYAPGVGAFGTGVIFGFVQIGRAAGRGGECVIVVGAVLHRA